jgi:hypothetical protein
MPTQSEIRYNVIKEAKKQHYSRLIAKSDNKIKNNIVYNKKGDRKNAFI